VNNTLHKGRMEKWLYKPLLIVKLIKWCHYELNDVKEVRNSFYFCYCVFVDYCLLHVGLFYGMFPTVSWCGRCYELVQWRRLCGQELLGLNHSSAIIITGLSLSLWSGCPTRRNLFASTAITVLPELYKSLLIRRRIKVLLIGRCKRTLKLTGCCRGCASSEALET
jgi:hypothetical protein